ncbi:MAG TPA: M3 family metallopeptidase [Burkholderiales bacterium]|nr:M3 family metallopeptidase [Burkholderiales bacterium]HKW50981.1 M3 family metallopeptidase [Candidatus Eisenbacteria bacterium]
MNPLLDFSGLPRYGEIRPEHVAPAVDELLAQNRALIAALTAMDAPVSWDDFAEPLESANDRLGRAWGAVAHLHAVDDNAAIRDAYNANLPKVTRYFTELAQNLDLYGRFKALRTSEDFETLSPARRRIVDNTLRDYRLGGAELPPEKKRRFAEIQDELAGLETKFSENILDATNAFSEVVADRAELLGIPEDVLRAAEEAARKDGRAGWKFTLQSPSYFPLMQYAENRGLRERFYRAHVTRASEFGKPELDNTSIIARELRLRREKAGLLGYASFAAFSLVAKMADSPEAALDFLNGLAAKALPHARRDYAELQEFARAELGIAHLRAWDVAFASEKLRATRYDFTDQEVKQYFPEQKVLEGMFRLVETLYAVRISPDQAETWHPDVKFFRIADSRGTLIGRFFLDPYARESKRGGAWMDEAITRQRRAGGLQAPVAHLVCNFPPPVDGKPSLLTHDEVMTLFHEFGHGLHHLLSRVDDLGVSGIRGVEWDAIELPSQFMENFCWEWDVLSGITADATGAPLPRSLFEKMTAAKNFQSGMQTVRQIEFALVDMHLHHDYDPEGTKPPQQLLEEIRSRIAVVLPPEYNRFLNNFSHVFSGSYAAGYYSYKWAEVLSADAYSLFEENGIVDSGTGARFRDEILAVGGSRPAIESFKAFRGREPRIDALLRHNGMIA